MILCARNPNCRGPRTIVLRPLVVQRLTGALGSTAVHLISLPYLSELQPRHCAWSVARIHALHTPSKPAGDEQFSARDRSASPATGQAIPPCAVWQTAR